MPRRRAIRVPASSANLGPGFDVFAAALSLHLELEVEETGAFGVRTDLAVPKDRSNLCVRGFSQLASADSFTFTVHSRIPLAGGLGSSAAAVVAGLLAAESIFELDADVEALAGQLEGHPDNAAAALHGGLVICAPGRASTRLELPSGLDAILVMPREPVVTARARATLAGEVTRADAVFNVAHASLLCLGLSRGDWDLVAAGLHDRLHQDSRAHLFPRSHALLGRARKMGALGATLSGAGPSVLVWSQHERTVALLDVLRAEAQDWAAVSLVPFEPRGARVREL